MEDNEIEVPKCAAWGMNLTALSQVYNVSKPSSVKLQVETVLKPLIFRSSLALRPSPTYKSPH